MATVERIEMDVYRVSGEFDTVYVLVSQDAMYNITYQVINTNEFDYGTYESRDLAIEWAEYYADKPDEDFDPEVGDGMTDAEADADALAGIGWGTDEDYGHAGDYDDCFDYDAYGDAF